MRVDFMGIPVDALTLDETVARAVAAMKARQRCHHIALNVAKFVKMRSDEELRRDVVESDIVGVDGMGIVWGAWLLGVEIPERVAGIDLFERLMEVCAQKGFRPYFLGAKENVLQSAIIRLRTKFPNLQLAGWRNGYFDTKQECEIIQTIQESGAECLFIGLPTPRKERLLAKFRDSLEVPFIMGVGGTFDVVGGAVSRSPQWMQAIGLEWFYRFLQEPRRMFWRYFTTNMAFAVLLVRAYASKTFTRHR
jgi:N-acetylglucosaminyldiphosphoundecaprenol N-acetyl-beta-D-mannosaminyltransferase